MSTQPFNQVRREGVGNNATTYTIRNLQPNTEYIVVILAQNGAGEGEQSDNGMAKTGFGGEKCYGSFTLYDAIISSETTSEVFAENHRPSSYLLYFSFLYSTVQEYIIVFSFTLDMLPEISLLNFTQIISLLCYFMQTSLPVYIDEHFLMYWSLAVTRPPTIAIQTTAINSQFSVRFTVSRSDGPISNYQVIVSRNNHTDSTSVTNIGPYSAVTRE